MCVCAYFSSTSPSVLCVCVCVIHQPICEVSASGAEDVEVAIEAAQRAFDSGPWRTMNARDRGKILYRCVNIM